MITKKLTNTLKKSLKHAEFSQIFTWGTRTINLGHNNAEQGPIQVEDVSNVAKVTMGKNHTAVLDGSGNLYTFGKGSDGALGNGGTAFQETPKKLSFFDGQSVADVACGAYHTIAATDDGAVYTWGKSETELPVLTDLIGASSALGLGNVGDVRDPTQVDALKDVSVGQVAAGKDHTVAVSSDGESLYMWGHGPYGVFTGHASNNLQYPTLIEEVSELLTERKETISKVKAAGDSTMILTSGGELFGWGGNDYAQLGNNHNKLNLGYKNVYQPTPVYNTYKGTIVDFDLSEDVLVFFTDANLVYYAGRYEEFVPKEVTVPFNGTVQSVGATTSGFAITTEEGKVYTFGNTLKTEKYFFDQELSLSDQGDFSGMRVCTVGGSYENVYAIAK